MEVKFNIKKDHFYGLILALFFLGAGFFVQAYGETTPVIMGHTFGELDGDLGGREITLTNGKLKLDYDPSSGEDIISNDYLEERLAKSWIHAGAFDNAFITCLSGVREDLDTFTCWNPRVKTLNTDGTTKQNFLEGESFTDWHADILCFALGGREVQEVTQGGPVTSWTVSRYSKTNLAWTTWPIVAPTSIITKVVCNKHDYNP
ncbi:hypothetical protein HOD88_02100 [archaeon]|jgi:hypothetical protein|nr:hypothetical protein [archaeon]